MYLSIARALTRFLLAGGPVFVCLILVAESRMGRAWLADLHPATLYIAAVVALALGWRFDRSRLVFSALAVTLGGAVLQFLPDLPLPEALSIDLVALLVPANITVLSLLEERGIFTWRGLLRWAVILAQPLIVALFYRSGHQDWLGAIQYQPIPASWLETLGLDTPPVSQTALLTFTLALTVTAVRGLRHHNAMEYGLFWALALMLYTLWNAAVPEIAAALFTGALIILIIALVETSHFMAYRDELTGLPARRALNQTLAKLGGRYSIAMVDVDFFKRFNDRYGHDVGDQALKMVAAKINAVRGGGRPFRYGGEEFTLVFPGKSLKESTAHLQTLRQAIALSNFTVRKRRRRNPNAPRGTGGHEKVIVTVSIGVAEAGADTKDPREVIKAADKALYRAKRAGRNRVSR